MQGREAYILIVLDFSWRFWWFLQIKFTGISEKNSGGDDMKEKRKPYRKMTIAELYAEAERLKFEIEQGHNIVRNQFKLLNLRDRIRKKRGGR